MEDSGLVRQRASEELARGRWAQAYELLRTDVPPAGRGPEDLELLAEAAYGAGAFEVAVEAREELHRLLADAGDAVGAAGAAVSVAMYLMMDTGLMAPVRGWAARAERLLEGRAEGPVHAWLAMVRTYERLLSGDLDGADRWAQRAIVLGTRHAQPAPAAVARVAAARLLVLAGQVEEGLALLDEAAVAVVSGELEPLAAGMVYCELICAMQGLAQYDRAEQWTEAMERWRRDAAFGGMNGRCRVHRAEILRLRGSCLEAETEALLACDELRPWMRREFGWPLTELGTIRLRKGDLDGAEEAFLDAHAHGWEPQPGLALVRFARGDAGGALASVTDALTHPRSVPSKERPPATALQRAPLLEAQVQLAVAVGDLATARLAADELGRTATTFRSSGLLAAAALAAGRLALAEGELPAAVEACGEAVHRWHEIGAPYEASVARTVLALAHRACGNHERARLELDAARATFEELGAGLQVAEVTGILAGGREGAHTRTPAPRSVEEVAAGTFRLEGDIRRIEFAGRVALVHDLKGMRYLARLLAEPRREFHVLDLVAREGAGGPERRQVAVEGLTVSHGGDLGPLLDDRAVQAYRRRLREVEDDLEEATGQRDLDRAARARADRDYLVQELANAFGLAGRQRPTGSSAERARVSVTRTLRYALRRIAEHHPLLGDHLARTVSTGLYCSYDPDPRVATTWEVEGTPAASAGSQ